MKLKPYPAYKESGAEGLDKIPTHWEAEPIKYNSYVKGRIGWQNLRSEEFTDTGPYLITGMHFKDGAVDWDACFHITEERYDMAPEIQIQPHDVLITKDGSIGKLAYIDSLSGKASLNSHLLVIRPLKKRYIPRYLFYLLSSAAFKVHIALTQTGTTFYGISQESVVNFTNLIPPIEEQSVVVSFLEKQTTKINTLIAKKKELLERLKEKRTALISHTVTRGLPPKAAKAVGLDPNPKLKPSGIDWLGDVPEHWEVLSLRRVVQTVKTGGTPSGVNDYYFEEEGFNWFSPSDFSDDVFLGKSKRALSDVGKKEMIVFPPMTVMHVGIGATIGKVGLSKDESSCNQQINGIICSNKLDPVFATYYLKTLRDFIYKCGKFTTMPIINQNETKSLIITIPPIPEQVAIVKLLDSETTKIDMMASKVNTAIERLLEYRSSLITSVVTGKIDVREVIA